MMAVLAASDDSFTTIFIVSSHFFLSQRCTYSYEARRLHRAFAHDSPPGLSLCIPNRYATFAS